jgi:hypothetical protein
MMKRVVGSSLMNLFQRKVHVENIQTPLFDHANTFFIVTTNYCHVMLWTSEVEKKSIGQNYIKTISRLFNTNYGFSR